MNLCDHDKEEIKNLLKWKKMYRKGELINMENEIKIGEYVRTKSGIILHIDKIERIQKDIRIEYRFWDEKKHLWGKIDDFLKHSKNIIDLIECGDYVNGYKITDKISNYLYTEVLKLNGDYKTICDYQIKSIVTKEQFKTIEYEVE